MNEQRYMISDASKKLEVEPHVLRYWEEELKMEIPRNEMGHRCYSEVEIRVLSSVKELKQNGFQLKAIKLLMPELYKKDGINMKKLLEKKEEWNQLAEQEELLFERGKKEEATQEESKTIAVLEDKDVLGGNQESKLDQFQLVMNKIIANALLDNNLLLGQAISEQVSERVVKEIDYQFRVKEEMEEQRFKKLDETIRSRQQARLEAAVALEKVQNPKKKKRKRFFSKKR
ncbi:MAG: MerR family transcriptional regulator [Firmicutes bacterium]|uniref:MerR family transcriptional regulator n=1 Tax=Candidatus Scybalomonas excrementavium TaxID=2840943 RepID=A0A9D9I0N6_9FIRM|nr:MerR family transcriptional regulator [Candidatus Scybalomonas excrementavium]